MSRKYDYDAIIIGAGISGLVCGCYLAKAGLKTLIVEKNVKPGGYCTSFTRDGFHFDACVHALSSLRKEGILNKILLELGIDNKIKFHRINPSDIIITPDVKIKIYNDINITIKEFQRCFPADKSQIENFFKYILYSNTLISLRSKTFKILLNEYFSDKRLKLIFSYMTLMCLGILPDKTSAFVASLLLKEFICDGGYYPIGGIQVLPDILLKRFIELKGDIILKHSVKKINISRNRITHILLDNDKYISSKYTVSACDAKQTFLKLIGENNVDLSTKNKLNSLIPSFSYFLLYLGIYNKFSEINELNSNIFLINDYNYVNKNIIDNPILMRNAIIHSTPKYNDLLKATNRTSICIASNICYKDFWSNKTRHILANKLINISARVIPDLSRNISFQTTATPCTFNKWTGNWHGAAFGWAGTPEQFSDPDISQHTRINNFYRTGHWCNQSSGVSLVANCGLITANLIINRERK